MPLVSIFQTRGGLTIATQKVQFELELPEELVAAFDSLDAAREEAREAFVMELVRQGKLSQGKAARLLGASRWDLTRTPSQTRDTGLPHDA